MICFVQGRDERENTVRSRHHSFCLRLSSRSPANAGVLGRRPSRTYSFRSPARGPTTLVDSASARGGQGRVNVAGPGESTTLAMRVFEDREPRERLAPCVQSGSAARRGR